MIKLVYTLFLSLLIVTFVGVGIAAFYPAPLPPKNDLVRSVRVPEGGVEEPVLVKDEKLDQEQIELNQAEWEEYREVEQQHNRNVAIISLVLAVITITVGTFILSKFIIADGLVLGGLFTLLYSIIRGFQSRDDIFRFIVVTVSLIITIILGQYKVVPHFKGKK